ncbi:MAG: hypothetical protein M3Q69_14610 [Acidobacteriota bacterium]|nr:hypothetical protein [Acidobacteriota bacterium]
MTRRTLFSGLLFLLLSSPSLFAAADREASRPAIMIPVAGTVTGANGTRFQTDLTITSLTSENTPTTLVDVYWLPRDTPGTGVPVKRLELPARRFVFLEDFVTRTLNLSGLGAIILRAVNADGSPNLAGRLDAFARIWTPVSGGSGTTSHSVHASTLYSPQIDDFQPIRGLIYGLRQDANFRSNYGLVNMGTKRLTFSVIFVTGESPNGEQTVTELVSVEAQSMTHRPVPAGVTGPVTIAVVAQQEFSMANPYAAIQPWTAYGTSVDNITGDGWYSKAQAAYPYNEH